MYVELWGRQFTDCGSGTAFYRCAINNFAGCCSVDPCSLADGCPDQGGGGNNNGGSSTTTSSRTTGEATQPTQTSSSPSTETGGPGQDSTSTGSGGYPAVPTESGTAGGGQGGGSSEGSSEGAVDGGDGGSPLSTGVIAGIAAGGFLLLLSIIILVCLCRRKRKRPKRRRESDIPGPTFDPDDAGKLTESMSTPSMSVRNAAFNDVFAPFGGRADRPNRGSDGQSYVSSVTDSMTASTSRVSRQTLSVDGAVQLDSSPVKTTFELGAGTAAPRPGVVELPAASPTSSSFAQKANGARQGHQYNRSGSSPLTPVAEDGPKTTATLNATENDRQHQTYVNSWSQYETMR